MFQQPSSGDMFKAADHVARLLLIEVREFVTDFPTAMGASDVVRADVTVLDAPDGPDVYENTVVFGRVLVGTLKGAVGGQPVLGRLAQGTAKPGQSAPYILNPFNDLEAQVAEAYVKSRATSSFAQAAPVAEPTPAPAPAPQAAPPTAAPASDDAALNALLKELGAAPA